MAIRYALQLKMHSPYSARSWNVFAVVAALFFILVFSLHLIFGTSMTYAGGLLAGCDLAQHYVAGLLWKEGRAADLYRDFKFSQRFIEWRDSLPVKAGFAIEPNSFNYVYSPILARASSFVVGLGFPTWLWLSLLAMGCSSALAWFFLDRLGTGVRVTRYEDWALLLCYPCFWYTVIPHQSSTFTFFLITLAALLDARRRSFAAGAVIACAFYKPHLVLALGVMSLAARRYRMFLGMAGFSCLLLLAQWLACGWGLMWGWVNSMNLSLTGAQFNWIGLNQSWRGWLLAIFGQTNATASLATLTVSVGLCALCGWWLHKLEMSKTIGPGHFLLLAAAFWTVASPYAAYYDFMMLLGLWVMACRSLPETPGNLLLCFSGWLVAALSASGASGSPWLTAPAVTLWLVWAVLTIRSTPVPYVDSGKAVPCPA